MAQRAYRQRKESVIDVLKQKVSELEKSKEDMGQEFLNFTTALLGQDSIKGSPEIIEHIKQSTLSLLCSARDDDDDQRMDDEGTDQSVPANNSEAGIPAAVTPGVEQFGDLDFSMLDGPAQWDYTNSLGPMANLQPNMNSTPYLQDASYYFQMPSNQAQAYQMNQQLPGALYAPSLPCPKSYAAHEVTFGRRLHRASQQGAFLLASMKHAPPTWYKRTFGFCLHFETRDEIRERLGECVRRSRDTLNIWTHPFTNAGGAGLFYPPNQDHGTGDLPIGNRFMEHEAYKPSEMSGFSMGPFGPSIQQVRDIHLDAQLRIIDPEYAGDWFDCDEVEISLRAYGVTIPPNQDFVTAYIDMEMFEREEDTEPSNSQPNDSNLPDSHMGTSDPTSVHCPAGMMGMAMGTMPPPPRSVLPEHWKTPSNRETKVKVDVERLTTCLVNSMVCLGRTPAVRPKDIRKALKLSLVNED
ncbi:hypothetical protein NW762_009091 [Fusarium torreyae]|uniref:BZIP domain-containing protein n=1 Tax=Fusarium torreyae TaxID=1237075 RepID=A0A9W8RTW2_9HYPO|nr:hypothetical protein NW762_009091 [Fusarium torreyae]